MTTFAQTFDRLVQHGTLDGSHRHAFARLYELNSHDRSPKAIELYARLARREVELGPFVPNPEHEAYARTLTDVAGRGFAAIFDRLVRDGRLEEQHLDAFKQLYDVNSHDRSPQHLEALARVARHVRRPAAAAAGAPPADRLLTLARDLPASKPTGDAELVQLHGDVEAYADANDVGFWTAASRVVGDPRLVEQAIEDAPLKVEDGVDPEQAEVDRRAREVARALQVSYMDAVVLVELDRELAEAEAETGRAPVAWADTSVPRPPQPYGKQSLEDRERDKLRAKAAGVTVPKEWWQAAAEDGVDLVYEQASKARAGRVRDLRAQRDTVLEQARSAERAKRQHALDAALDQQARDRLRAR